MKVWTTNGTTEIALCDHGRKGPSSFAPQVQRNKQIQTHLRAKKATPIDRGNALYIWAFASTRQHDSITAAELYLVELHKNVPSQAEVQIEFHDQTTRRILPDCFIEFSNPVLLGVSTTVTWMLTFSELLNPPTEGIDAGGQQMVDAGGEEMFFQNN